MRVHIVGAGPTGMSVAWELLRSTDHEVIIYDRKPSAGGAWWEPSIETKRYTRTQIVFDNAFVNTDSLFREMGIKSGMIYLNSKIMDMYIRVIQKNLHIEDYTDRVPNTPRVLMPSNTNTKISLKRRNRWSI